MTKPTSEKNGEVPSHILPKLLTASELRMLKNRWKIIELIERGLSVRQIAKKVQVGTDTVVRVTKLIRENNIKLTKPISPNPKTSWIFGKAEE